MSDVGPKFYYFRPLPVCHRIALLLNYCGNKDDGQDEYDAVRERER